MFSVKEGDPIAIITSGDHVGEILSITENKNKGMSKNIELKTGNLEPLLSSGERSIEYIAGPSGSGKTTYAAKLIRNYSKLYPKANIILFSRKPYEDEPEFKGLLMNQVIIDNNIVNQRIDITQGIEPGTIFIFDDIGTIYDNKQKEAVQKLVMDIMEIGRSYKIYIILTSHLIIPNEKKFARVVLNELQYLTVFPNSGVSRNIEYVLKNYLGFSKVDINKVINNKERWVRIHARAPRFVLYSKGAYML